MTWSRLLICAAVWFGAAGIICAETAAVYGYLYRHNPGATSPTPLQGYEVYLYSQPSGWIGPSVSDGYGRYALYSVPPGKYLMRIYTYGCVAWEQEIEVAGKIDPIVLPQYREIRVANTSRPVGNGRWDWTVFIQAGEEVLKRVAYVEYRLHPTFPNPVRKVDKLGDPKSAFALSTNGWGTFRIPVKVVFDNGEMRCLEHLLIFEAR